MKKIRLPVDLIDNPKYKKLTYAKRRKLPSQKRIGSRIQWTPEKYAAIVKGGVQYGIPGGLRSYFYGFDKEDGFDTTRIKQWTPTMRKKVRERYHRYKLINGQPKRFVRVRNADNKKKLQEAFHDEIPSSDMKGAFVPDTQPITTPGFKQKPMKVRVMKTGISIDRPGLYRRQFIPFDQKTLARSPKKEIKRAAAAMEGKIKLYFVQVGEFQSLTGMDLPLITRQVLDWMAQYDGKKQLPGSSGNRGDSPKHHHWKHWLKGLVGYQVEGRKSAMDIAREIVKGRRINDELKRLRANFERREEAPARKGQGVKQIRKPVAKKRKRKAQRRFKL